MLVVLLVKLLIARAWVLAAASWPTAYSTAKIRLHAGNFWKMSFFGNDDPFRHKTQQMCCTWSVRVCVQNFTIVRHGIPDHIGARENDILIFDIKMIFFSDI